MIRSRQGPSPRGGARMASAPAVALLASVVTAACSGGDAAPVTLALESTDAKVSPLAQQVTTRRAWSGDAAIDVSGDPSPDGRLLSFVDRLDLAVRDLAEGTTRHLTRNGPMSADFATFPAFSPDGRRLAYAWWALVGGGGDAPPVRAYQLRVMDLDGAEATAVIERAGAVRPFDWTPDGQRVLAQIWRGTDGMTPEVGPGELALVSLDGAIRTLVATPGCLEAAVSPDGRWVAYDRPTNGLGATSPRDVMVVGTEGGGPHAVVQGPSHDRLLGWLADPDALLVLSDRSGSPALWLVPMADGQAAGEPELLRADLGPIENVGVSGNVFAYSVTLEPQQVVVAEVDVEAGRVTSSPVPVSRVPARSSQPTWSHDGRFLAYLVRLGLGHRVALVIQGPDGTQLRELPLPMSEVTSLQWTRDADALLAWGTDASGTVAVHRIDLGTGGTSPVAPLTERSQRQPQLSPDDSTLYFLWDGPRPVHGLYALDLASQRMRTVYERAGPGGHLNMALSPDGDRIAFNSVEFDGATGTRTWRMMIVSSQGGEPREVIRFPSGYSPSFSGMSWSPDGRHLLYVRSSDAGRERHESVDELWSLDVTTGLERKLLEDTRIRHVHLHPDGRRIAYTRGDGRREIWLMEGFATPRTPEP